MWDFLVDAGLGQSASRQRNYLKINALRMGWRDLGANFATSTPLIQPNRPPRAGASEELSLNREQRRRQLLSAQAAFLLRGAGTRAYSDILQKRINNRTWRFILTKWFK
jgi:hypothetical protein